MKTTVEVTNCLVYSADKVCSKCISTKFLSNNVCEDTTATNCYTFETTSKCATCNPDSPYKYGLKTESGVTSCVDKNISYCLVYTTDSTTFACAICNTSTYVDSTTGTCLPVDPAI